MTRVNPSPEVLYIWKKKQRSSKEEDEDSMACLTHKKRLEGKYLSALLSVWGLGMRVGVRLLSNHLETYKLTIIWISVLLLL